MNISDELKIIITYNGENIKYENIPEKVELSQVLGALEIVKFMLVNRALTQKGDGNEPNV